MAFNLKNIYEVFGHNKQYSNGDRIVVEKKMSKNVLGQINPNGVIEINKDATPANKRRAVKHEQVHLDQIRLGLLGLLGLLVYARYLIVVSSIDESNNVLELQVVTVF